MRPTSAKKKRTRLSKTSRVPLMLLTPGNPPQNAARYVHKTGLSSGAAHKARKFSKSACAKSTLELTKIIEHKTICHQRTPAAQPSKPLYLLRCRSSGKHRDRNTHNPKKRRQGSRSKEALSAADRSEESLYRRRAGLHRPEARQRREHQPQHQTLPLCAARARHGLRPTNRL